MTSSILTSSTTTSEPTKKSKSKKKKYRKKVKNILTKKRRPLEPTSTPPPIETPAPISTQTSTQTSKPTPTSTPPPSHANTETLYYPKTAEDCYKYGYIGRLTVSEFCSSLSKRSLNSDLYFKNYSKLIFSGKWISFDN